MRVYAGVGRTDSDDYVAYSPDFAGCLCRSKNRAKALDLLSRTLCLHIAALEQSGYAIPEPSSKEKIANVLKCGFEIDVVEVDEGGEACLFSSGEAAEILNMSKASVVTKARTDEIKHSRIGNANVIMKDALIDIYKRRKGL